MKSEPMKPEQAARLLNAYVDRELDLATTLEFEAHLANDPAARAAVEDLTRLSTAVRADATYFAAPARLAALSALSGESETAGNGRKPRFAGPTSIRWWLPGSAALKLAAGFAAGVLLAVAVISLGRQPGHETRVGNDVVAAHVRATLGNRLTDVASSDQHTVKPWFQGKLDYAVTVTDFASEGFPLVGGRLDYIEDAPAAALVYKRALHVVNLFVWPSKLGGDRALSLFLRRGYRALRWTKGGMNHLAVSDLDEVDLKKFVDLVQRR